MSTRTIVISIDNLNAALLDEASRSVDYPALSSLRQQGGAVHLEGLGLSSESDWYSFFTGCEPCVHRHVGYDEIILGTYRSRLSSGSRALQRSFLHSIAISGKKVVALNPSHLNVEVADNLQMITMFHVHDAGQYFPLESHPVELAAKLHHRFPNDPVNPNDWGHSKVADPQRLLRGKQETLKRKFQVFEEMLDGEDWDLAFLGLDECHEMSHLFWHLHDDKHFAHEQAGQAAISPIRVMLSDIDRSIAKLLASVPDDIEVAIVSTSGIAANYHWSHLVDRILDQFENQDKTRASSYTFFRKLWNRLPHKVQRIFFKLRHRLRETMLEGRRRKSIAFAMPLNEVAGAVRLNLQGREPNGLVAPEDYERTCEELKNKFESLVCAETGINLVKKVKLSRECQKGSYVDLLPDLIIEWNTDKKISQVVSPHSGTIHREFDDARTGHHINAGFLLTNSAEDGDEKTVPVIPLVRIAPALIARQQGSPYSLHKLLQTDLK